MLMELLAQPGQPLLCSSPFYSHKQHEIKRTAPGSFWATGGKAPRRKTLGFVAFGSRQKPMKP